MNSFDVIVVGGGHAGIEAACSVAQFKQTVLLISLKSVPVGSMPCNPSVGGIGKGQVVREIDALGGVMGKFSDLSAIQYRTLNTSKGHAVRSTRQQVDKYVYSEIATRYIESNEYISLLRDKVINVSRLSNKFIVSCETSSLKYFCSKVIVTTGTFLGGITHIGEEKKSGGRYDCESAPFANNFLQEFGFSFLRFKTGTPPRLISSSIDFSKCVPQESDPESINFHYKHAVSDRFLRQMTCYLTRTNEKTLDIIRSNRERSPLFNGQISGVGPRYCPSIEDKAFRHPDRDSHHIFLEPESIDGETIYPSGISTSLPKDVQVDFLNSIPGLESVKIKSFGYAVEYDVIDSSTLNRSLESIDVPGLYFAGQVNGTSGYEEAAAQGLVAGMNCGLSLRESDARLSLSRNDSYIGVMIEDLITQKRDEPYRLFTARAENRLLLREDNTISRITPFRKILGLETDIDRYNLFHVEQINKISKFCDNKRFYEGKDKDFFETNGFGSLSKDITLSELLKRPEVDPIKTLVDILKNESIEIDIKVAAEVAISKKYEGYIDKANQQNERLLNKDSKRINWKQLIESTNISNECKQRIARIRPEYFSELKNIEGIRPATISYVAGLLR